MKKSILIEAIVLICLTVFAFTGWTSETGTAVSADEAVNLLKQGNERYVLGTPQHPNADQSRRDLTSTEGQKPFVTVLTCSDSRVPAEILFDQGIGDVFVIRVAGNVVDTDEAGSIEYGVDHLNTPLLVVLGHTSCGAVSAVVGNVELHGNIPPLVDNIQPAAEKAKADHPELSGNDLVNQTVKTNVWQSIADLLKTSPVTVKRVKSGALTILGAVYDLKTGKVEFMGTHPDQEKLLSAAAEPKH